MESFTSVCHVEEKMLGSSSIFGITILHEAISVRVHFFCANSAVNAGPNANFGWMFQVWLVTRFWTFFTAAKSTIGSSWSSLIAAYNVFKIIIDYRRGFLKYIDTLYVQLLKSI